jgi:DNA phosphorothioation-dependent restriction protein DptG
MMLTVLFLRLQPTYAPPARMMTTHTSAFSILYSVQITLNNRYWDTSDECRSQPLLSVQICDCVRGQHMKIQIISLGAPEFP